MKSSDNECEIYFRFHTNYVYFEAFFVNLGINSSFYIRKNNDNEITLFGNLPSLHRINDIRKNKFVLAKFLSLSPNISLVINNTISKKSSANDTRVYYIDDFTNNANEKVWCIVKRISVRLTKDFFTKVHDNREEAQLLANAMIEFMNFAIDFNHAIIMSRNDISLQDWFYSNLFPLNKINPSDELTYLILHDHSLNKEDQIKDFIDKFGAGVVAYSNESENGIVVPYGEDGSDIQYSDIIKFFFRASYIFPNDNEYISIYIRYITENTNFQNFTLEFPDDYADLFQQLPSLLGNDKDILTPMFELMPVMSSIAYCTYLLDRDGYVNAIPCDKNDDAINYINNLILTYKNFRFEKNFITVNADTVINLTFDNWHDFSEMMKLIYVSCAICNEMNSLETNLKKYRIKHLLDVGMKILKIIAKFNRLN